MAAYHDWGTHYLGWANYQHESWHFPIGHIENYNYPSGTNIGFTDSIPLFAIFFKLFSSLLPDTFQYFGLWLLSCHLLTGYFTYKILKRYTSNSILLILSVLLVSYSPVLIYRMMHPALCAHWLLIASIYYYTKKATLKNVYSINNKQIIITVLSALINPYLFLMVIGFNIILPLKHYFFDQLISLKRAIIYVIIPMVASLFLWLIIGMISFGSQDDSMEVEKAYGLYGLNLNALYNSSGFSSFFPQLPSYSVHQYEGYAYLGLGVFILIAISIVYIILKLFSLKSKTLRYYLWLVPFIIVLVALSLFAISNKISINDKLLFEFYLPSLILKVGNIFRASGRFIWLFYYSIYLFTLICLLKFKWSGNIKIVVLLLIVSLQFYDIKLFMTSKDYDYGKYEIKRLNEKEWTAMTSNFTKIITYPLFENNLIYPLDYQDLCFIALKNKLPITSGYVARNSGNENSEFKTHIESEISNAMINDNDLYIIAPAYLKDFNALISKDKVEYGFLDGYYYLYSKQNNKMGQRKFKSFEKQMKDSINSALRDANTLKIISKPNYSTNQIQFNIEKNTFNNEILIIEGWAFLKDVKSKMTDSVYIVLDSDDKTYLTKTEIKERPDVAQHFKSDSLKNSGFKAIVYTDGIENADYKVLIGIKSNNLWTFESSNQPVFNLNRAYPPVKLTKLPFESEHVKYNIERNQDESGELYISGWAYIKNENSLNSTIEIVLENSTGTSYTIKTLQNQRSDVTAHFKSEANYDNSGFIAKVRKQDLNNGTYTIGVLISNNSKVIEYKLTDAIVTIKN